MSEPRLTTRGLARRELLLDVASDLFLAKGFDGVSIDEIIARAGGSKTNIYRQFGGKEGLFIGVVEHLSAQFLSPLRALELGPVAPEVGLAILARTLLRQLLVPRHVAFQRMILAGSEQFPGLMARWYDVGPRQSQAIIAAFLGGDARAQGVALLFHDMIVTDPVSRAMMGQPRSWAEVETHIDAAVDLVIRGQG